MSATLIISHLRVSRLDGRKVANWQRVTLCQPYFPCFEAFEEMLLVIKTAVEIISEQDDGKAVQFYKPDNKKWVSLESLQKQLSEIYTLEDLSWLEKQLIEIEG
jgi:hypothetical protein